MTPSLSAGLDSSSQLVVVRGLDDGSPVVYAAIHQVIVASHAEGFRINARAGGDDHAHPFRLGFDDGVGGEGGAQVQPGHLGRVHIHQNSSQGLPDGTEQIVMLGDYLGFGLDFKAIQDDGVRVGAAYVNSQKHKLSFAAAAAATAGPVGKYRGKIS